MFVLTTADDEITRFDISVDDLIAMQVFDAIDHLQSHQQNSLEREPSAASGSKCLQIVPQLFDNQIGPAVLLEGLPDLRKAVEVGLFQFLVCLDLVLH